MSTPPSYLKRTRDYLKRFDGDLDRIDQDYKDGRITAEEKKSQTALYARVHNTVLENEKITLANLNEQIELEKAILANDAEIRELDRYARTHGGYTPANWEKKGVLHREERHYEDVVRRVFDMSVNKYLRGVF